MGKGKYGHRESEYGEWRDDGPPFYLTVDQTGEFYGLSPRTLRGLRQRRLIRFTRAGHRTVLIHRASLEHYLNRQTSPAIGEGRG